MLINIETTGPSRFLTAFTPSLVEIGPLNTFTAAYNLPNTTSKRRNPCLLPSSSDFGRPVFRMKSYERACSTFHLRLGIFVSGSIVYVTAKKTANKAAKILSVFCKSG